MISPKTRPNAEVGYGLGKAGAKTEEGTPLCFCSQVVDLPEPVTLDFLDAEVEDSDKEEVQTQTVTEAEMIPSEQVYLNYTSLSGTLKSGVMWRAATVQLYLLIHWFLLTLTVVILSVAFAQWNRFLWPFLPKIRRQMIDGQAGEMTIKTLVKSMDEVQEHIKKYLCALRACVVHI